MLPTYGSARVDAARVGRRPVHVQLGAIPCFVTVDMTRYGRTRLLTQNNDIG